MKIIPTKIKDVLVIEPDVFEDHRGWFVEYYNKQKWADAGMNIDFIQDNVSFTKKSGTLRGLHFQNSPFSQAKLVSCIGGAVLDVVVDLRKNSPTYKKWFSIELTEENKKQLFIPRGFAHGFLSLTDNSMVEYKVDNSYNKQAERILRFNDPEIGISWGNNNPILLERDEKAPLLKDCDVNF
ncbi:dTDP-4-dehydrorhamnose 3,5-epimerase [Candidatus Nomurabacteria bacterium RIFCSPLOWO2_01_FULL_42_17]|uniref:dTDP-4-dehydrorhamnose 3,5-epimerase n=1 Tax=Candidatus Nomurabacteria bacterium RIFCSPLOWO2_01_FULL_42_17 TaxID=1801780 RepID=A0A1F6XNE7_9BACT|nr:MAG: dTDP-4-dehydrorhamnose 3,5-epimerase [Candidatus Nomurabacteria bacterium RIFCSPLOWO2_01_FULL_42_17]